MLIVTLNVLLNFLSFAYANMMGTRGYRLYFPLRSKLVLVVSILSSCVARMIGILVYFAPSLGLFDLLYHYKGKTLRKLFEKETEVQDFFFYFTAEKFGFKWLDPIGVGNDPVYTDHYIDTLFNMTVVSQIQRGNYTVAMNDIGDFSVYEPPPLEIYTYASKKVYFLTFLGLHFLQILTIFVIRTTLLKTTYDVSLWMNFITAVEQSHFPFPYNDWDAEGGGCLDHIKRKEMAKREFLFITMINLLFNFVLLCPMIMLCKNIFQSR